MGYSRTGFIRYSDDVTSRPAHDDRHVRFSFALSRFLQLAPSWRNVVPDSAFISGLYDRKLPGTIPHYLLFSYSGRSNRMDENNDGAVTLESQLDYRVQRWARAIYGFNENHVKVLFSEDVIDIFNDILRQRAEALPRRKPSRMRIFEGMDSTPPDPDRLSSKVPWRSDQH